MLGVSIDALVALYLPVVAAWWQTGAVIVDRCAVAHLPARADVSTAWAVGSPAQIEVSLRNPHLEDLTV